jgi:hypothetical protein
VVVQVVDMENSFGKFMLEGQNIKTIVEAGVVGHGGRVFGIVGIDFCDAKVVEPVDVKAVVEKVCRSAEKVQYYLQYRDVPPSGR